MMYQVPPFKGFPMMENCNPELNVEATVRYLCRDVEQLRERVARIERDTSPLLPTQFDFAQALGLLKNGHNITRACWRNPEIKVFLYHSERMDCMDELRVRTASGKAAPWMPNHSELLADDWMLSKG